MSQLPVVVQHAPRLAPADAERLAMERYRVAGSASPLPSERDQNFRIRPGAGQGSVGAPGEATPRGVAGARADAAEFVLKIANQTERREILDLQNQALAWLAARTNGLALPRVVRDIDGEAIGATRHAGAEHMVRLLTWVPGKVLADVRPHSRELLVALGRALGEMDRGLQGFEHPALGRPLQWDLARTPWIAAELSRFGDAARERLVARVLARFESQSSRLAGLRRQAVHNDWNDHNVLVGPYLPPSQNARPLGPYLPPSHDALGDAEGRAVQNASSADTAPPTVQAASAADTAPDRVLTAVDFGDMLESWTVADLAVACAYAMLGKPDPIAAAAAIVEGYHASLPLTEDELEVLLDLIRARLAISVTMSACQSAQAPGNDYLRISEQQAWHLLAALDAVDPGWARACFRKACGLTAGKGSAAVRDWLAAHRDSFAPVVARDLRNGPVTVLDLSVGSLDIPNLALVENLEQFSRLVDEQLRSCAERQVWGRSFRFAPDGRPEGRPQLLSTAPPVAVGRYDESRLVYVSELFRHVGNWEVENRTVHLGIDLFLPAGEEVRAPLAGRVHSVRNNVGAGDYGPTIILAHKTESGIHFFTLYGHLSAGAIDGLAPGRAVAAGDLIGRLGDARVNGGWPPHLHFQVITDLLGRAGDFPGVAAPGERAVYLDLCPDPNLILGIPADRFPPPAPSPDAVLAARRDHFGPNLSVSYRRPLTIVRGHMQFLFDADGRRFLDAVNNVPHVGHSHPRVVAAAARQLAVLNSNTRYLHPLLASYAERLASLMPAPLSVCYIVCSGSEANELALRLAYGWRARQRAAARPTSPPGIVVVDGAYHGNTTSLVNISPYKFDGPGGSGRPPQTRVVPMPDVFRGAYKAGPDAGVRYAAHVSEAIGEFRAEGRSVAAFFCESLLSCGGQIALPEGYLRAAYEAVRAAGGVCVADEVQVGFGRVGTHWWGFETQGVVPDIVTLGKPIGNGFPLAAVVTRREIAEAFDNGMEYFNTFGGSHAACAAGHAVLDVMRDEDLQARALAVGDHLRAGLASLADRFPLVGDVRGLGLFLGIEFVRDRATLEPAAPQAAYVVNRLRDRGILTSTDGPLHDVVKIKPPLQFSRDDADRLVNELAAVLEEDGAQA